MSVPLKCPQCGASEANLLQDTIYQCKFCGSIYEYGDVKPVFENTAKMQKPLTHDDTRTYNETQRTPEFAGKVIKSISISILIAFAAIGTAVYTILKKHAAPKTISTITSTSKDLYSDKNETNNSFAVVNTDNGPQVWTVSRRNSEGLKEVSYFLNQVDIKENKIITSTPIKSTITWQQSLKDEYRMNQLKPMGKICWLIYGENLLGYNVNTGEEEINNETLSRQFQELKNGIAKIEDVYDMDGFKLTTKDGYIYYFATTINKLYTEKQHEDKNKIETDFTDKTEYCFTDNERQQLYKINKKAGKLFDSKISGYILNGIVKDDGDWYRRVYKINSAEEFTPNEVYFKAAVLYYDSTRIIFIFQKELGENAPIFLKCFDVNKNELWTKTGNLTTEFKPFLKSTNSESFLHGNQLTIIQPYQLAVCLNIDNGEVNWSFKPY